MENLQAFAERIRAFAEEYLSWATLPKISVTDVIEIVLIWFVVYHVILWFKQSRAWPLLKGIVLICLLALAAYLLQMSTILWLINRLLDVGLIALVILFQPELRRALEQLGRKGMMSGLLSFDPKAPEARFSDHTIDELVNACFEMGRQRTGALIVIERDVSLAEYEQTGIEIDALVSEALLLNIFEKDTPLHDGAVIMRGDRVTAATCYLPLTDNNSLNKSLGTRHRAGIGVSEETDSLTIIVSEESGAVSLAEDGKLSHDVTEEYLRKQLVRAQEKHEDAKKKLKKWKGLAKREKTAD